MVDAVEKMTKKIAWHESEAKRLRAALDVFHEFLRDESGEPVNDLSESTFRDALEIILAGGTRKTTRQIRDALQAGHFKSESTDFSVMVANRLADAYRRKQIMKHGKGRKVTWSLPPSSSTPKQA